MLVFRPNLSINHQWDNLIRDIKCIAKDYVQTSEYKKSLMYTHGASEVSNLPTGGWISKQASSYDFFVMGGLPETEMLEFKFRQLFPILDFTPATICYSSKSVPLHKDSIKNGLCSLVYPLHDHNSISRVYDSNGGTEEYRFLKDQPVILNITKQHEVMNTGERIWFSIHFHNSIEQVRDEFNKLGSVII